MIRAHHLVVVGTLGLVACVPTGTTLTAEQRMAVACQSFAEALVTLAPLRSQMTPAQDQAVLASAEIVVPTCDDVLIDGQPVTLSILKQVEQKLTELLAVQTKVQGNG